LDVVAGATVDFDDARAEVGEAGDAEGAA